MIYKNGNIGYNIQECNSGNLLNGTHYTRDNPYTLTGTGKDIIYTSNNYCQVTPGKSYYLLCEIDKEWSPSHGYSENSKGKATLWLYMSKTYNPSSMGYDNPVCFTSSNQVKAGVWKYTVPAGYNMARVRLNTYADGANAVSVKFWDIKLIPEEEFIDSAISSMKISSEDTLIINNIIEM